MDWEKDLYEYQDDQFEPVDEGEDFRVGFKHLQDVHLVHEQPPKFLQTPHEKSMSQVHGIVDSKIYNHLSAGDKEKISKMLDGLETLEFYHLPTMVLAAVWIVMGYALEKKSFQDFAKNYAEILGGVRTKKKTTERNEILRQADLLRYIRILSK